jgi:hypothetical protein
VTTARGGRTSIKAAVRTSAGSERRQVTVSVENTGLVEVITTVVKFVVLARRVTDVQAGH